MIYSNITFHADDYGISLKQSKVILDCCLNGKLNSLSVLPNSPKLKSTIDELVKYRNKIKIGFHLNLVEGLCCSNPKYLNLLVDEKGYFKLSFEKLLFMSFSKYRKELKQQIYIELKSQILKLKSEMPFLNSIRIDSHQHFHMIPIVFDALLEVISDQKLNIEYIRFPKEPILPFLKTPKLYLHYNPINWIKNILLNVLASINIKKIKSSKIKYSIFFGLVFTGNMDKQYVSKLLPSFIKIADKKGLDLEVLFHPGYINNNSDFLDIRKKGFVNFYTSNGRINEKNTLCSL